MSGFLSYIHNLRGVAILFVIGVHVRGTAGDWISHPFTHDFIASLFDAQEGNGTVMFLFIAGFLFQHIMHTRFKFSKYIEQKFKFIILPYILISIPIIIWRVQNNYLPWSLEPSFLEQPKSLQFLYHLVFGTHLSPFWFISAIVMFYCTAPLLHWLDKPFFYRYVFPVIFIVGMFTFRPFNNGNPFLSYLHYLPIYLTGMWASYNKERFFSMDLRYFWILTAIYVLLFTLDMSNTFAIAKGVTFEQVLNGQVFIFNFYLFRTVLLCFMMAMLFYKIQFIHLPFLEVLAEYSFGLYFVHFLLIVATRKALQLIDVKIDFNVLTFVLLYLFIIGISTAVVYLVKRLTGRYSRSFIGS
jgi:probable poly-beta-1,6-N-acetyl-D-glucosamine export protein